jgi:hypothetical protein
MYRSPAKAARESKTVQLKADKERSLLIALENSGVSKKSEIDRWLQSGVTRARYACRQNEEI